MNWDLRKAGQALARGDRDEARVYAWNALATIKPEETMPLLRLAEELDDKLLILEIERRGITAEPEPAQNSAAVTRARALFFFALVAAVVLITVNSQLGEAGSIEPTEKQTTLLQQTGLPLLREHSGIWLVRIGQSKRVPLQKLADDVSLRYRLPVGVLPEIDLVPRNALDGPEQQLIGEELLAELARRYHADGTATIIGVTDYDMRSRELDLSYTFSLRSIERYGVVSTSRLNGDVIDRIRGNTRYKRTRKLVARNIGFLFLRRPQADDPHSLLRSPMSGSGDIDALVEKL